MITILVNNKKFEGWESIQINKQLDTLCGTFSFIASNKSIYDFPVSQNDPCKIFVNDEAVMSGYIEKFAIHYDSVGGGGNHNITIGGRDKTADIADSTLGNNIVLPTKTTLTKIAALVLKNIGITDIKVITDIEIEEFNTNQNINAKIGTNAYEFIKEYALQRQVLVVTNSDGNLLFTRASTNPIATPLINIKNGKQNNILSADLMTDYTRRFHTYNFYGNGNISAYALDWAHPSKIPTPKDVSNVSDTATDTDVRSSRVLNKKLSKSTDQATIKNRAAWEERLRKINSFSYVAMVPFLIAKKDGTIWQPNMLVDIHDDLCGINDKYLLNSVSYELSVQDGTLCTLGFVEKNAYDLRLKVGAAESKKPLVLE